MDILDPPEWRVCIGIGGGFAVGTDGGFGVGISGGFANGMTGGIHWNTHHDLISAQNQGMLQHFPDAEITVEELDLGAGAEGAIRTAENMYRALEVTAFAEFEKFILFIVLLTPEVVHKRNRRKLEYVIRKAVPFSITYSSH